MNADADGHPDFKGPEPAGEHWNAKLIREATRNRAARQFVVKDSGARSVYASGMVRDTQDGKPRFDLLRPRDVPFSAQFMTRLALLMTNGAGKYGFRNWEQADSREEVERFEGSAERHLNQYLAGDDDEDHAAAVVFNLLAAETTRWKIADAARETRAILDDPETMDAITEGERGSLPSYFPCGKCGVALEPGLELCTQCARNVSLRLPTPQGHYCDSGNCGTCGDGTGDWPKGSVVIVEYYPSVNAGPWVEFRAANVHTTGTENIGWLKTQVCKRWGLGPVEHLIDLRPAGIAEATDSEALLGDILVPGGTMLFDIRQPVPFFEPQRVIPADEMAPQPSSGHDNPLGLPDPDTHPFFT